MTILWELLTFKLYSFAFDVSFKGIEVFTELEVGIAGTNMIASTENSLHDQRNTQSVEQPEVLRYTKVLQGKPWNTQWNL